MGVSVCACVEYMRVDLNVLLCIYSAAAYLANRDRKVSVIFETADVALASSSPLPEFIRKSRLLAILSPSRFIRTRLE